MNKIRKAIIAGFAAAVTALTSGFWSRAEGGVTFEEAAAIVTGAVAAGLAGGYATYAMPNEPAVNEPAEPTG